MLPSRSFRFPVGLPVRAIFSVLGCLLIVALVVSTAMGGDESPSPAIEIFWSADELGIARPSAEEVREAVSRLQTQSPQVAPAPRAAYPDSVDDLLFKWLGSHDDDYGLSAAGGVMSTDIPSVALALPPAHYWRAITFDRYDSDLSAFDYVPNSSMGYFGGSTVTVSDGTSTATPAFADLTRVVVSPVDEHTRWQLTSRGPHPGFPDAYRLGYNNIIEFGSNELVQFIGATQFSAAGWYWAIRDRGTFFPWWNADLDVAEVGVEPTGNDGILFSARVDGALADSYASDAAWPRFEWFLDADNDPNTGDTFTFSYQEGSYVFRYDLVGIEVIASAFYEPGNGSWVGMVRNKVSAGNWQTLSRPTATVAGDRVSLVVPQSEAGVRATFRWGLVSSFDIERGGLGFSGRVDVAPNSGMKTERLIVDPNQLLAEKYAPIVYRAGGELLFPVGVEYTLSESHLKTPGAAPIESPDEEQLYLHRSDGSNLDLVGEDAEETIEHWNTPNGRARPPVVYARVYTAGERTAIQYWFHYYYSGWGASKGCYAPGLCFGTGWGEEGFGNNHEGDWEMIQVVLRNDTPELAVYAQHFGSSKRLWEHVEREGPEGSNPVVYIAEGSHASYFKDSYYYDDVFVVGDYLAEETGRHATPALEVRLLPSAEAPRWLPFEGRWGDDDGQGGSGRGPRWSDVNQERENWADPFNWADGVEWDDEKHYGIFTSRAFKVSIAGTESRHVDLQLRNAFYGGVILGKGVNQLDATGRRAEFLLNCANNARQSLLLHKQDMPLGSFIWFDAHLSQVNCLTATGRRPERVDSVSLTIDLNIPQEDEGVVQLARYENVTLSTDGAAGIDPFSADLVLQVDNNGDGIVDTTIAPTSVTSEPMDMVAPEPIGDLVFVSPGALLWTAPPDEGPAGRVAAYEARYAEFPVTEGTWEFAQPIVHSLSPGLPGTEEFLPLEGLPAGEYFFAVRSADLDNNVSALSNTVAGTIQGPVSQFLLYSPVVIHD